MQFDLSDKNHINTIVSEVYSPQNSEYRKKIDKQWRILRGDLKFFVEDHLKSIFPKTYKSFTASDINIAKKISEKLAVAYREQPDRQCVSNGTSSDGDTEFYDSVMDKTKSSWVLRDFDLYRNYFKYSAIWFSFYEDEDGKQTPILRALRPNQFSRIVNDKGDTEVFIVYLGSGGLDSSYQIDGDGNLTNIQDQPEDNDKKRLAIWTKTQHRIIDVETSANSTRIVDVPIEGNEQMVNQLGVIPAVFDQDGSSEELPAINSLSDQTINANYILSVIITGMAAQSFGQLVVSHPAEQTIPDTMQQGLFTFVKLPQEGVDSPATTADYISPTPDLANMTNVYRNYVADILEEHGVTGGEAVNGSQKFTSGLDRLLSEMDTTQKVEINQESYAQKEDELFQIFKQFYAEIGEYQFKSENLVVTFKKPSPMMGDKELLEIIAENERLGLIERWEKLTMKNPNLSKEDAIAKLAKIDKEKQDRMDMFNANFEETGNEDPELKADLSAVQKDKEQRRDKEENR